MNPETGHLLDLNSETARKHFGEFESIDSATKTLDRLNYRILPEELQEKAKAVLGDLEEVCINLKEDSALANWAAEQRNKIKPYEVGDIIKELEKLNQKARVTAHV